MCRIEMGSWMLGVDRCLIKVEKGFGECHSSKGSHLILGFLF